jgi:glycosyltransferase involved in cell wall biosynthesis
MPRVLILAPNQLGTAPGQRLRVEQWAPYLQQQGWQVDFLTFSAPQLQSVMYQQGRYARKVAAVLLNLARYVRALRRLPIERYDVACIHREATMVGPPYVERNLVSRGLPLVYDFDDPIFLPIQSQRSPLLTVGRWYSKVSEICRISAHIIVSNDYLRRYAVELNPNVSIIPIGMRIAELPARIDYQLQQPPVVGWTGSFSTAPFISSIGPVLARVQRETGCTIRLIGAPAEFQLPGVHVEVLPWSAEREMQAIAGFDIGINPLPIDDWTKGKGTGKTLQYLSQGIPAVATPTGGNLEILDDGVNGYLPQDHESWHVAITRLLADEALRRSLGRAGRARAEQSFDIRDHAAQVAAIFERVSRQRGHLPGGAPLDRPG